MSLTHSRRNHLLKEAFQAHLPGLVVPCLGTHCLDRKNREKPKGSENLGARCSARWKQGLGWKWLPRQETWMEGLSTPCTLQVEKTDSGPVPLGLAF